MTMKIKDSFIKNSKTKIPCFAKRRDSAKPTVITTQRDVCIGWLKSELHLKQLQADYNVELKKIFPEICNQRSVIYIIALIIKRYTLRLYKYVLCILVMLLIEWQCNKSSFTKIH